MDKRYYNELSKLNTLTQEETLQLIARAKQGDNKATDQIIKGHLRLTVYYAKKYVRLISGNNALDLSDLINEGNMGLIKALNTYDPAHGTKFSYYASILIRNEITGCMQDNQIDMESLQIECLEIHEPIADEHEVEEEPNELKMLRIALKHLKPRARKIIKQYFGIDADKKNMAEIGSELSISKERVRQLIEVALRDIRSNWTRQLG